MCGRLGCLEGYASGTSIAARATEAASAAGDSTTLSQLAQIRGEDVSAAALAGDEVAAAVWQETVDVLGQAITDLVNTFEPNMVVLGGGVTRTGSQLLDPVRAMVARDAMPPAAAAARVELAALGDEVCVVGAAALAFDRISESALA
jgi:glucokinase